MREPAIPHARRPISTTVAALVSAMAMTALLAAGLSAAPAAARADGTMMDRLSGAIAAAASGTASAPVTAPEAAEPEPPTPPSTEPSPVGHAQLDALQLNKMAFSCEAGQTRTLKVVASNAVDDLTSLTVTWSSSNTAVATVDGAGVVTALAKGTAVISAATTVDGSSFVSECLVTVTNDRVQVTSTDLAPFQSAHDYADGSSDVWVWHQDRATGAQVVFDDRCALEDGFDFVELRGADDRLIGRYTGTELAGLSLKIEGDTFSVRLLSDESGTAWGFAVVSITPTVPDAAVPGSGTSAGTDAPAVPAGPEVPGTPDVPMGVEDPADLGESYVKVPDFFGMSLWEARDLAWALGLGCDDVWQYCDWAESGTVIWQDVDAGVIVQPGAGVVLTVSAGPETVMMPDVCGIYWEDAKWQLEALGLIVDYYWDWAEGAGIDEVMWQSCAAGEQIAPGSYVTIAISAGPEPMYFTMPDYSYYWYQYPLEELTSWGATVVINDEIWAESEAEEGCVYWSDPAPGEPVAYGSIVTLYVTRFMDGTPVVAG